MAIRFLSNETIDGTLVITKGITTGSAAGGNSGSVTIAGGITQSFQADGSTVTYGSHTNTATATSNTDASAFLISQKNTGGTAIEYRQGVIADGNAFFGKWQSGSITGIGLNVATGNVTFSGSLTGTTGTFTGLVSGITPTAASNYAIKSYVDAHGGGVGPFLPLAGGTMSGNINMGDRKITNINEMSFGANAYITSPSNSLVRFNQTSVDIASGNLTASGSGTFGGTVTTTDVYGTSSLRTAALGGIHYVDASSSLIFRTSGSFTERMRIDQTHGDKTFISSYSGGTFPLRIGFGSYASFTPTFVINDNGYVGIGVTGPGETLELAGNIRIHNSSNAPYIDFVESGATSDSKARITMDQVDTNNGQLIFSTEGSGTLTERMRITSSGGISFGSSGTAYGSSGQLLQSNGNASPTWITSSSQDINTIVVTVVSTGSGNKYFLDGEQQINAILQPGFTYRFDQSNSSNNGHPLRFSSDAANSSPYTTGVSAVGTPGSAGAYTQIITTQITPVNLYYYCTIHSGMGSAATIRIIKTDGNATFAKSITVGTGNSSIAGDLYFGANADIFKSSGNLTLDVGGNIILDADGGFVAIKDGGTEIGNFGNSSSDFAITASVQDKDILFKGNDNGSVITALQLDMSNGGSATFRDDIDFGGKITQTGTGANTFGGDVGIGTSSFNHFTNAKELLIEGDSTNTNSVVQVISNDNNSSLGMYSGASSTDDPLLVYQNDLRFGSTTDTGLQAFAERMRIASNGAIGIGGANYGTSGQVLTSNGNAAPSWQAAGGGGGASSLNGLSDCLVVGSSLAVGTVPSSLAASSVSNTILGLFAGSSLEISKQNTIIGNLAAENAIGSIEKNVFTNLSNNAQNHTVGNFTLTVAGTFPWDPNVDFIITINSSGVFSGVADGSSPPTSSLPGTVTVPTSLIGGSSNESFISSRVGNALFENNVIIGHDAWTTGTLGQDLVVIGTNAAYSAGTGTSNQSFDSVVIGKDASYYTQDLQNTVIIGSEAYFFGQQNVSNATARNGVVIGSGAMKGISTTDYVNDFGSVAIGYRAAFRNKSGTSYNVAIGLQSLYGFPASFPSTTGLTGDNNVAIGRNSGYRIQSGSNNICVGYNAGDTNSPVTITSQSNYICLGNNSITNAYIRVAFTVTSDERDKAEIKPLGLGLDFINNLKPISFKFKKEVGEKYIKNEEGNEEELNPDYIPSRQSTEVEQEQRYGFSAQDVLLLEGDEPVIVDNKNTEKLGLRTEVIIPILVKAIQELKAEIELLKKK